MSDGASQTSKLELFTKKVNGFKQKNNFYKKFHLRCLNNTNSYLTPYTIPTPSLITRSPYSRIKLQRIEIFKADFRKLSILPKFRKWNIWQGVCVWWGGERHSIFCWLGTTPNASRSRKISIKSQLTHYLCLKLIRKMF